MSHKTYLKTLIKHLKIIKKKYSIVGALAANILERYIGMIIRDRKPFTSPLLEILKFYVKIINQIFIKPYLYDIHNSF